MLPRCIAYLGKDTLIGILLITFTWINTFSYPLYMKFALMGYIVSMARILYVHVIGAIALLPRRDYFAMIIKIASMARILYFLRHWRNYAFTEIIRVFCWCKFFQWICIFNLLKHIVFCFFQTSDFKKVSFVMCSVLLLCSK